MHSQHYGGQPGHQQGSIRAALQGVGFLDQPFPYADVTDPHTVTIPNFPGIQSTNLTQPPPNADDMNRNLVETPSGPVIQTKTSNLITCPNAEGDVSLGCWLFSSDNDQAVRRHLQTDEMPGENQPKEIMVVPGNWMELAGTTASPGNYSTVTADLYNTETLPSEQRIFTGVMMNSNTGELYETYEDEVPPPNTDRKRLLEEQMSIQNPKLTALSGGWDPSMPKRHKVEVEEVEYGSDAGRNVWGPQLFATALRDIAEQHDVMQQFNNRDGFVPVEPAWDRRAVGFVGYVSAYRGAPFMPPTQREARDDPNTFKKTVSNVASGIEMPGMYTSQMEDKATSQTQNRGMSATVCGASLSDANLVPGRLQFRDSSKKSEKNRKSTGGYASQIYDDGAVRLRKEPAVIDYHRAPDSVVVQRIERTPVHQRVPKLADAWLSEVRTMSSDFAGIDSAPRDYSSHPHRVWRRDSTTDAPAGPMDTGGLQSRGDPGTPRHVFRNDTTQANSRADPISTSELGNHPRLRKSSLRIVRSDKDPARQYTTVANTTDTGTQHRVPAQRRRTVRTDQDPERSRVSSSTTLEGARDGRPADELAFLASVRLITDRSGENVTARGHAISMDTLEANQKPGALAARRLATERAYNERAHGLSTDAGSAVYGKRVADWTSHVKDSSFRHEHRGGVMMHEGDRGDRIFRDAETLREVDEFHRPHAGNPMPASTLYAGRNQDARDDGIQLGRTRRNSQRGFLTTNRESVMNYA